METKIGIKTRYVSRPLKMGRLAPLDGCANSDLACTAALAALKRAGVDKSQIQLLLVATCTPDYPVPSTATIVQEKLGLGEVAAIDIRSACSGFAQALTVASQFLKTGYYNTVMVIGSEVTSTTGNLDLSAPGASVSDRVNASMMGDGAAAFLMQSFSETDVTSGFARGHELLYCKVNSIGVGQTPGLYMPAGGSLIPISQEAIDQGLHFHKQDFRRVLSHGAELYVRGINDALNALNKSIVDVDLIVPHQANGKLAHIGKGLGFDESKIFMNFERVGNTANASLGLCIDELAEQDSLPDGALVLALAAESTKWLYGTFVLRWSARDNDAVRARPHASLLARTYSRIIWQLVSLWALLKRWLKL